MELKFGKHKGKTIEEVAKTEEGRGYLRWLRDCPTEGEYEAANIKRNQHINGILELHKSLETVEVPEVQVNKEVHEKLNKIKELVAEIESYV